MAFSLIQTNSFIRVVPTVVELIVCCTVEYLQFHYWLHLWCCSTQANESRAYTYIWASIRWKPTALKQQSKNPFPGRIPGYTRSDLQLLPSKSKHTIWETYHKAAEAVGAIHPVAYTTFCHLWHRLVPSILVMKPRSDLCCQCQQNSAAIVRTTNSLDAVKSQATMECRIFLAGLMFNAE